jgi:NADPH:quinone reductase-like Zn-dependent oxidoreductase
MHIPDPMSFEEAATLGVGITTIGQSLYQSLRLPFPITAEANGNGQHTNSGTILIYGGSTATGALGIQFAKLSGLRVFTTCSSSQFDYVLKLGADEAFDYRSKTCAHDIQARVGQDDYQVLDCISTEASLEICVRTFGRDGGKYATLLTLPEQKVSQLNGKVHMSESLVYTTLGNPFILASWKFESSPEDLEYASRFWQLAKKLFDDGKVKPHRMSVNLEGKGLEGALLGLDLLRKGEVHGTKLVYSVAN